MDAMGWEKERPGGSQGRRADLSVSALSVPLKHPIPVLARPALDILLREGSG